MEPNLLFLCTLIYPSLGILGMKRYDSICEFPQLSGILLGPAVFYSITVVMATYISYKLKFYKYDLPVVRGPWSAFLGCLFFWRYFFPHFIENRGLVARKNAVVRDGKRRDIFRYGVKMVFVSSIGHL